MIPASAGGAGKGSFTAVKTTPTKNPANKAKRTVDVESVAIFSPKPSTDSNLDQQIAREKSPH